MCYYPKDNDEIIQLVLRGYGVCECGALMENAKDDFEYYVCPACGKRWFLPDYETNGPYAEMADGCILVHENSFWDVPEGCRVCGCDYPRCKTSCSRFDD